MLRRELMAAVIAGGGGGGCGARMTPTWYITRAH